MDVHPIWVCGERAAVFFNETSLHWPPEQIVGETFQRLHGCEVDTFKYSQFSLLRRISGMEGEEKQMEEKTSWSAFVVFFA